MTKIGKIGVAATLALGLAWTASPVSAQGLGNFYKGKQITIAIGYGFGGTYGKYSRLFSEYMRKYIPGNPNIIVQSMPGAGGIKMTNYSYNVMPRQGYHMFVPPDTIVVSQLLRPKKIRYNTPEFTWLGAANQTNTIFVVRKDSGIKTWKDMRTKQIFSGNTGPGSTAFLIPRMAKTLLGMKIKQISGYKGSRNTVLAMERNEHQGTGFNWLAWNSIVPHWFDKGREFAVPILQTGVWVDPDLPNVPMMRDLVAEKDKPIIAFMATLGLVGRGLALPPGAPRKLVAPLRAAFTSMVKDPEFVQNAKKRRLRVIESKGEDIQATIEKVFKTTDKKVIARASRIIFGGK